MPLFDVMLRLVGGIALLMVATFMTIGLAASGVKPGEVPLTIFVALLVIVVPGVTGVMLLRQHVREPRAVVAAPAPVAALPPRDLESRVVRLAEQKGGRLTVIEVVGECGIDADSAEATFTDLVARGMAEVQMTDSGLTVYVFGDILKLKDKTRSHDVLDES